jgi:hypothetical protein
MRVIFKYLACQGQEIRLNLEAKRSGRIKFVLAVEKYADFMGMDHMIEIR